MNCPFCDATLTRKEIEQWGSFTCPRCHELLRVRRNYTIRILRLAMIGGLLYFVLSTASVWVRQHFGIGLFISAGMIGLIDESLMRLLPAKIEAAAPGGFTAPRVQK